MIPKFRAAMFDMDGTLLYSMRYWRLTTIELLLGRGIFPTQEQLARVWYTSSRALCKEILHEHGLEMDDRSILRELEYYMHHHYKQDVVLKPDVQAYLEKLRQEGIPMCVATAAPREFALEALTQLGIAHYFSFITDCYEQEMSKREPEFFFRMAERLGTEPGDMCVFEDAHYSMKSAKEAGCPVIAIRDETQRMDWALIEQTADLFIDGYAELL